MSSNNWRITYSAIILQFLLLKYFNFPKVISKRNYDHDCSSIMFSSSLSQPFYHSVFHIALYFPYPTALREKTLSPNSCTLRLRLPPNNLITVHYISQFSITPFLILFPSSRIIANVSLETQFAFAITNPSFTVSKPPIPTLHFLTICSVC